MGFPTERMAHVAAKNVAAQIRDETLRAHEEFGDIPAVCVMDAGNNTFLWKARCGYVSLP